MTATARRLSLAITVSALLHALGLTALGLFWTPLSAPPAPVPTPMLVTLLPRPAPRPIPRRPLPRRPVPPPRPHRPHPVTRRLPKPVPIRRATPERPSPRATPHHRPRPIAAGGREPSPATRPAPRVAAPRPTVPSARPAAPHLLAMRAPQPDIAPPAGSSGQDFSAPDLPAASPGGSGGGAGRGAGQGGSGSGSGQGTGAGSGGGGPFGVGNGTGNGEGPRHIVYLLDVSLSMESRIDRAKKELRDAMATLGRDESFDLIVFGGDSFAFDNALVPATPRTIAQADGYLSTVQLHEGTNLEAAVTRALNIPGVNVIVLITDGVPTQGETDFKKLARHVRDLNTGHARIFTVGLVGKDPDGRDESFEATRLLKQISHDSGGTFRLVSLGVATPD